MCPTSLANSGSKPAGPSLSKLWPIDTTIYPQTSSRRRAACRRKVRKLDSAELLLGNCEVGRQLRPQTPLQLLAQLRHFHARHHNKFAAQHLARLVVVRQLARNAAILAFLIPAKSTIRNRLRADELEATQKRIALGHLKFLPQNRNFHQLLVRTERFRHG